jgi:hypothetical protein
MEIKHCLIIIPLFLLLLFLIYLPVTNLKAQTTNHEEINDVDMKLNWIPFNTTQNLNIQSIGLNSTPAFLLKGDTDNKSSGFNAHKQYNGTFISVTTGKINKTHNNQSDPNSQFTISFKIKGNKNNYILSFVNGRLSEEGWVDNNFYQPIEANESKLVNLQNLISLKNDQYSNIEKIILGLEKDTKANPISFHIGFFDTFIPIQDINNTSDQSSITR